MAGQMKSSGGANSAIGLKNKVHVLSKGTTSKLHHGGQASNGSKTREPSKDSVKKKTYSSLNSGGAKHKFGQPKPSVKPPAKKQTFLPL